jgi:hypothetical protein
MAAFFVVRLSYGNNHSDNNEDTANAAKVFLKNGSFNGKDFLFIFCAILSML